MAIVKNIIGAPAPNHSMRGIASDQDTRTMWVLTYDFTGSDINTPVGSYLYAFDLTSPTWDFSRTVTLSGGIWRIIDVNSDISIGIVDGVIYLLHKSKTKSRNRVPVVAIHAPAGCSS